MINKKINYIKIGTRGSPLAIWQAKQVLNKIENGKIIKIKTTADIMVNISLSEIGGKGLFTRELDQALLKNKIDIAVHSLKDIPTNLSKKIGLTCILPRGNHEDILIPAKIEWDLLSLPKNSIIGTSSPRRTTQLKILRPDITIIPIRGNIHSRLKQLNEKNIDGIILALAGIKRLNIQTNYSILENTSFLPSAGQGIIAITYLKNNTKIKNLLKKHENFQTLQQAIAERSVLKVLNGDCDSAIAANSKVLKENIYITSNVYSLNGKKIIQSSLKGSIIDAKILGKKLGEKLIKQGALEILKNDK